MFVVEIPSDVNYRAPNLRLPDYFLDDAQYKPDEPERLRWKAVRRLLPDGRQRRLNKCGVFALHVVKTGAAGAVEGVHPVSCMDKVACPYCSAKYAEEMALERFGKLGQICAAHDAALGIIEARATIPAWNAAIRAQGCKTAEERGKLCTSNCHACDTAQPLHAQAAAIEADLHTRLTKAWTRRSPGTGGVYVTTLEQRNPLEPITLVVRVIVPSVAVQVTQGNATKVEYRPVDLRALETDWRAACARYEGTVATLTGHACNDPHAVAEALALAHEPAMAQLERAAAAGILTPAVVQTFARAAGLGGTTRTGRARRCQRTAWFGVFSGRHQTRALAALGLTVSTSDTHARVTIQDHYKILRIGPDVVDVQSTRTAEKKEIPRRLWRASYVDPVGGPVTAPDPATWEYVTGRDYAAELLHYRRILGGGGNIRIVAPRDERAHQRAQRVLWGSSMGVQP